MKLISPLLAVILFSAALFAGCVNHTEDARSLQQQFDSLRTSLNSLYKPGMGELMSNIQLHHSKLWFAGENKNWPLAEYNESLIQSAFKKIQLYHGKQPEAKAAFMNCHAVTSHPFNVITIPKIPPVTDQDFRQRIQ